MDPLIQHGDKREQDVKKSNIGLILYYGVASILVITWATIEIVYEKTGKANPEDHHRFEWIKNMVAFTIFSILYGILKIVAIVFFAMAY